MRALLQRVARASVRVEDREIAAIGPGLVVLVGVGHNDDEAIVDGLARQIVELRMFPDEDGRTNRSIVEVAGGILVVSQFTLYATTSKGRRPGFTDAAPAPLAERMCERLARRFTELGISPVATGRFGTSMALELVNDGPFTLWLDTNAEASTRSRT